MRITLLTDFGTVDGYVAAMKGAITRIAPSVLIDDASHAIAPGDIVGAALALQRYWKLYPAGSVHVVVVDPGVGGERRALAARADDRFLVGPDNGVLALALGAAAECKIIELSTATRDGISRTFHGRDVFAPAAARLATGEPIENIGRVITDPLMITLPPPIATESIVRGEIVQIDRFGNLVTNIAAELVRAGQVARVGEQEIRLVGTYTEANAGELVALINSDNVVEIALRDGSAALALNVERGTAVELHRG